MSLRRARIAAALLSAGMMMVAAVAMPRHARAQTTSNVTVTAGSPIGSIPPVAFGANTAVWDNNLGDTALPRLIYNAGISALRYPGGSTSDLYNWQSNSIVPGQGSYANPNNGFDAFMKLANAAAATPVITVNYGSDPTGVDGGSPTLAAQWVQYANITKTYHVKYWEIGNEVYGNGEYGAKWETDLHSAHDPSTYGANVVQFAQAMKAVDPSIKIGAVLTLPGSWPDGQTPDWNSNVLAAAGKSIDFVIVHWYAQAAGSETDSGLLAAPQGSAGGQTGIAARVADLRALIAQYCGANAPNVQIFVTEMNSTLNPGKQTLSPVNAMFLADGVMTWLENGVGNVDWWAVYNGAVTNGNNSSSLYGTATYGDYGLLSSGGIEPPADTPFPSYYGMQMLSTLGKAGDTMVAASSSNPLLGVHAVHQANGNLAVLLLNKDPRNNATATVSVPGYSPAATATAYAYGPATSTISATTLSGIAGSFAVTTAPYTMTTVVLTQAGNQGNPPAPSYSLAASPNSLTLTQGTTATVRLALTSSASLPAGITFAVTGVPSGVTATMGPVVSGVATVTLAASTTAAPVTAVFSVAANGGTTLANTTIALTVAAAPNFSIAASPSALTLAQGGTASTALSVDAINGFTGAVSYAVSSLPQGVTASVSGAGVLTLTASASASIGAGTATVTGASGPLVRSLVIPITVTKGASGSTGAPGPASIVGMVGSNSPWFNEDDLVVTANTAISGLTVTITVPATDVSFGAGFNTYGGGIAQTSTSGGKIVYTVSFPAGTPMRTGQFLVAMQTKGDGKLHAVSSDQWTASYSAGGVSYHQSGGF